jgi:hypothetical protein
VRTRDLAALVLSVTLVGCGGPSSSPVAAPFPSPSVTASAAPTTRPGAEGTTCGKLTDYASTGPADILLTLEVRLADQSAKTWRYHLTRPGTAPSDLGTRFAGGVPQVIYINGWFAPVNPSSPSEVNVSDFKVMRITELCPITY